MIDVKLNDINEHYEVLKPQYHFAGDLPENIKNDIRLYTTNDSVELNEKMREGEPLSKKQQRILNSIDYALENVPKTKREITLYRGVVAKKDTLKINVESVISATYDPKNAIGFIHKCCMLVITIPVGSSILPIQYISHFAIEGEILLNRKGVYYITGYGKVNFRNEIKKIAEEKETFFITYIPPESPVL